MLELKKYRHRDDIVELVEVTEENVDEVAAWCGGDVKTVPIEETGEQKVLGVDIIVSLMKFPALASLNTVFIGDYLLRHADDKRFSIRQPDSLLKYYEPGGTEGYDEGTLHKVYDALGDAGLDSVQILDAVNAMQNRGILFRENI